MRVLLIDDNSDLCFSLKPFFSEHNIELSCLFSLEEARRVVQEQQFDAIILDWMMKDGDGVEFLRWMREIDAVPVLMLSSKDRDIDKVKALESGADDYLQKPFSNIELLARINALVRRDKMVKAPILKVGEVVLDPKRKEVTYKGKRVELFPKEYKILEILMQNRGVVLSKYQIQEAISADGDVKMSNVVEAHIKNLRKKLPKELIETVRGVGYVIRKSEK